MNEHIDIKTDNGNLTVTLVTGPRPYLWIGDKNGNHLDTFDLEGTPLTRRRERVA